MKRHGCSGSALHIYLPRAIAPITLNIYWHTIAFDWNFDANDWCITTFNSAGGVMTSATNCTFDGLDRLSQLGYEVDWLWYDVIALVLYSTLFLTIAYLALLLIKKEK